jgi:hypothetical protein
MDSITNFLNASKSLAAPSEQELAQLAPEMAAFVEAALRAAGELAQKWVRNAGGHLSRDGATTIARVFAQAYGNHTDAPDYLPRSPEDAEAFVPHGWILAAIMQGYREGHGEGHAEGIQWMKDASARRREADKQAESRIREAAQAVLDRWDSPQWKWLKQGPKADLMKVLRDELAATSTDDAAQAVDAAGSGTLKRRGGLVLVPARMSKAMLDVTESEGWTWADLLAAAEAITEEEYEALQAEAQGSGYTAATEVQGTGARYTVEKHGSGWAIYTGRDLHHHGLNWGQLSECDEALAKRIQLALNAWASSTRPAPVDSAGERGRQHVAGLRSIRERHVLNGEEQAALTVAIEVMRNPPEMPTNEALEKVASGHKGHPADFAADVLQRWGGWQAGLLGYGGKINAVGMAQANHAATLTFSAPNGDQIVAHGTVMDMMTLDQIFKESSPWRKTLGEAAQQGTKGSQQ